MVCKDTGRVLGGSPIMSGRSVILAPHLKKAGKLRGRGTFVVDKSFKSPRQFGCQSSPAGWREFVVQCLLIKNMDERVSQRERVVVKLLFAEKTDQIVHPLKPLQALLDLHSIEA